MTDDDSHTDPTPTESAPNEEENSVTTSTDDSDDVPFEWTQDEPPDSADDAPFEELVAEVKQRRSPLEEGEDPFEEMDVGDVDADNVWEALGEQPDEDPVDGESMDRTGRPDVDRSEHVVDKRQYCQRCPYLSAPPDVACKHDGTEIVEVVSSDQFLVRGCPMVAEGGPRIGSDS